MPNCHSFLISGGCQGMIPVQLNNKRLSINSIIWKITEGRGNLKSWAFRIITLLRDLLRKIQVRIVGKILLDKRWELSYWLRKRRKLIIHKKLTSSKKLYKGSKECRISLKEVTCLTTTVFKKLEFKHSMSFVSMKKTLKKCKKYFWWWKELWNR